MLIVLQTDFGYKDPYVGVMKGVIKTINPQAEILDLTHGVSRHNILEAAVNLLVSARYFPRDTIFVTVVDPGVGTQRRALVIRTRNYYLVGPDNGVLSLLALRDGVLEAYDVSKSPYNLPNISNTFHGRDVFAPVAAWLSRGTPLHQLGIRVSPDSLVTLAIRKPDVYPDRGFFEAIVLGADVFGNVFLYAGRKEVEEIGIRLGDRLLVESEKGSFECTMVNTFGDVKLGEFACFINSWGFFEIAVNQGDASKIMSVNPLDKVKISKKI